MGEDINLEDFRFEAQLGVYAGMGKVLDYKKIIELPDEDFMKLHVKLMSEYKEKDGWWKVNDGRVGCSLCNEHIENPSKMIRYEGRTLHIPCYKSIVEEERKENRGPGWSMPISESEKKYWNRLAQLDVDQMSILYDKMQD